jgi:hypothetical protein
MNLNKLGRTFWVIAAVAIMAMVLQGCGGDDNGGISQSMHDQVVMDRDELDEDVKELQGQLMALLTALGASDNMGAMTEITQLQTDLMNLQGALDSDGDTAAALMEITRITTQIGELEGDVMKADMAAAQMKMMMLFNDLGPVSATSLTGDNNDDDNVVRMSTERDMKKTDMELDAPYEVTGWNGMSWSRDLRNNDSEMAVMYDNKEDAVARAFNKAYDLNDDGAVPLVAADHGKLIEVDNLPVHVNHPALMIGVTNGVKGMFDGVPGTFLAVTNAVDVTVDDDGNATWATDSTLTFKPDSATATVMMKDANYVSLGWWLRTDMDMDGNLEAVMAWVASSAEGADYAAGDKLNGLQGKATFMGIAAGKYAIMTPASVNTGASYEAGHFTADAELVADFETATDDGTMTGTISDFEQDGMSLGDWMVQLAEGFDTGDDEEFDATMGKDIGATGALAIETTRNGARGTFGDAEVFGTWQARFSDNSRNDEMPGSIGGEFALGAENDLVRMIGAFGADNTVADSKE